MLKNFTVNNFQISVISLLILLSVLLILNLGKSGASRWTDKDVTVGFTNKNEIIIYNNKTNKLDIYDENIVKFIFWSYSKKVHEDLTK